jgi:predicted nuclease of predicted toxin-antitoxin system
LEFLANENFPLHSIKILREKGYQIKSVAEEHQGASDLDILIKAHKENLIIITFDRDYGELIFKNREVKPAGIIYLRFIPETKDEPAQILQEVFKNKSIQLLKKFTVVEKDRVRQRIL